MHYHYPMSTNLNIIMPYLNPNLVSINNISYIQNFAKLLPSFSPAGFECHLGACHSKQVGFHFKIPCISWKLSNDLIANPSWQIIQDFCHEWFKQHSNFYSNIDNVIVELDINENSSQIPFPCVFVAIKKRNTKDNTQNLIKIVYRLFSYKVSSRVISKFEHCIDCLLNMSKGEITHIGVMLARKDKTIRINVGNIKLDQFLKYLNLIGWSKSQKNLLPLLNEVTQFVDYIIFSLDIDENVYPRIGLECFFKKQPKYEPRWKKLLNFLIQKKLCTELEKDGLLSWPGIVQKESASDIWPKHLFITDTFFYHRALSLFWRKINHIKLVCNEKSIIEAKGYLSFGHKWIDTTKLTNSHLTINR